jgi:hypothetical protein
VAVTVFFRIAVDFPAGRRPLLVPLPEPGGAAASGALSSSRNDCQLDRGMHPFVELDRDIVFPEGLDGVVEIDLAMVNFEPLLLEGFGHLVGVDGAVEPVTGGDLAHDGDFSTVHIAAMPRAASTFSLRRFSMAFC